MPLLLPNLDDRRWADLVDEGRSLIPVYGPEWTDHNVHDPGITIMELLAWIAEMDIYRLNQISDDEKRKFLALIEVFPKPPRAARTVLSIRLKNGSAPRTLPRSLEFSVLVPSKEPTRYRTLYQLTIVPGFLEALQFRDSLGFHDLTPDWRRRTITYPFGKAPAPGMEFYLGFSTALPVGVPTDLFFTFADGYSGRDEQCRLRTEAMEAKRECAPPDNPCCQAGEDYQDDDENELTSHYGVRTVWEFLATVSGKPEWIALNMEKDEVQDGTRTLTLDEVVRVILPAAMTSKRVGAVVNSLYYLRCRFAAGRYDAAPALQDLALNGVPVEQAVPANMSFIVNADAEIEYSPSGPPEPNDWTALLRIKFDSWKRISALTFGDGADTDPKFRILQYKKPSGSTQGELNIEAVLLGFGNDFPAQHFTAPGAPVKQTGFRLYTLEGQTWRRWELRRDFDASASTDSDFVIEPTEGIVTLGDGRNGRVAPGSAAGLSERSMIFATYRTTQAEAGNLAAETVYQLADSYHNRALLYDQSSHSDGWQQLKEELASITNSIQAAGGAPAETIRQAAGRADRLVDSSERAVTLEDYEQLARRTPGTRIARATARRNLHPAFSCFDAPGMITVIILPYLPQGRPVPSAGLLRTVAGYLRRRRLVGTRVEVVGPKYLEVTIRARVQAKVGANKVSLQPTIVKALNDFLDPLVGGPDGTGWPFGRDVYRAEIMRVIDEVVGVDHVISMELVGEGCEPQCGNVCLGPTWLAAAGPHEITVL